LAKGEEGEEEEDEEDEEGKKNKKKSREMTGQGMSGGYLKKYLKYKQKYLDLKKELNKLTIN